MIVMVASGCGPKNSDPPKKPESGTVSQSAHQIGGVAILDLDQIAKRFGCDKQMHTSLQQREASLNQQLASIKASYEKQIAEKRQEFGNTPNAEQAKLLAGIQRQAVASLNKVRQQAKNNLNQHGSLLINGFRKEIKPIAREVARKKGLSVIVTKNDSVIFDYATTVDITADVIEKLLALQPKQAPTGEQESSNQTETASRSAHTAQEITR